MSEAYSRNAYYEPGALIITKRSVHDTEPVFEFVIAEKFALDQYDDKQLRVTKHIYNINADHCVEQVVFWDGCAALTQAHERSKQNFDR